MQVDHIAGRYFVHPNVDVIHEPEYPGDVAEYGITHWEVWRGAEQDRPGCWTYEWSEWFDTEAEAVAEAHRLARLEAAAGVDLGEGGRDAER